MYKPQGTLKDAIGSIEQKKWVLPAIQREFVWRPDQVCTLFDSLMQGFPFGTFLFWKVSADHSGDWQFYDFVRDYHERDAPHCPELGPISEREVTAVLDGQQRLTALNIGLRGSLSLKRKHARTSSANAFPKWHMYLNLLYEPPAETTNTDGEPLTREQYSFKFLEAPTQNVEDGQLWFRVSDILKMPAGPEMLEWLMKMGLQNELLGRAYRTLDRLHQAIHKDQVVYCYEEEGQDIEKVLKIFIRLNKQGTPLSQSDLLHSIAVAQWSERDARQEISRLVDDLNKTGSWWGTFRQNFVLKAGLMLADVASVGFKVENFTRKNMALLERDWDAIRQALLLTSSLASSFGLSSQNLRAISSLLPIAYYLFLRRHGDNFLTHTKYAQDRSQIRHWLIASLLKPSGIWGSGLDTLLTALREVIRSSDDDGFPASELRKVMEGRGKSLTFSVTEVERLADASYRENNTFLLLTLLSPHVDLRNKFHVDHIFPSSLLTPTSLKKTGLTPEQMALFTSRRDRLTNLQLMDGAENNEKRSKLPGQWISERYPTEKEKSHYRSLYDLGDVPLDTIEDFERFYTQRRISIVARIKSELNTLCVSALL